MSSSGSPPLLATLFVLPDLIMLFHGRVVVYLCAWTGSSAAWQVVYGQCCINMGCSGLGLPILSLQFHDAVEMGAFSKNL